MSTSTSFFQKALSLAQRRSKSTSFLCGPYNAIADHPNWYRPVSQEVYKYYKHGGINLYSTKDAFAGMQEAGRLAANTLRHLCDFIEPGQSTMDIADETKSFIESNGGVATSIGFSGFPASICTSNNFVACHGVPSKSEVLKQGDLIKCDVTCSVDGWHGDTCYTYYVGDVSQMSKELALFLSVSQRARDVAVEFCGPGSDIYQIGNVVEKYLVEMIQASEIDGVKKTATEPQLYSVLKEYTGHGIGRKIHEPPEVSHSPNPTNIQGYLMFPGMMFTIEPIIMLNGPAPRKNGKVSFVDQDDQWSVVVPNTLSAQFEHCVGITESGYQVFTIPDRPYPDVWNHVLSKLRDS